MTANLHIAHKVSAVQRAFIDSGVLENCLMGPRGEGKTEAGIVAIHFHALAQASAYRPMPWAVVRDTWANLERTTLQSIIVPRPESFAAKILPYLKIREGGRQIELPGLWKLWLFGADSAADLNKLQSMQLAGLWLEEAAPAATEDIGSGVAEDLWTIGITSLRHPVTTNRRAQITMNYPDEDHWTWQRFYMADDPERALFQIPRGANKHVDDQYRRNMYNALKDKPQLLARLVEGKPAHVYQGEAVTPEYSLNHRADVVLEPIRDKKLMRSWDGGLNPSCVIWQITPSGRVFVLDALRGENMGMRQMIETMVKPLLSERYEGCKEWEDSGDPALNERDQSDSTVRAAAVIEKELDTTFLPGISSWESRKETIKELLNRQVEGLPMVLLSKRATILHAALSGGWHYKKTPTGAILRDIPMKDKHSHPADAFCHHLAKVFGSREEVPIQTVTQVLDSMDFSGRW